MKVRVLIAATLVALVVPAAAIGATNKLKGKFESDSSVNATISLNVVLNSDKKPTKVKSVAVKDLNYRCPKDDTAGKLTFSLAGPFKLKYDKSLKAYIFNKSLTADGRDYDLFFKVAKNGKSANGTVEFEFKNAAGNACLNAVLGFNAKK